MSEMKYIRDAKRGTLVLNDPAKVASFKEKRNLTEEINRLSKDINTLKTQMSELQSALKTIQKSK